MLRDLDMSQKTVLSDLFAALQIAVMECLGGGKFRLLAEPPPWFSTLLPNQRPKMTGFSLLDTVPFLQNFLIDAEHFWANPSREGLSSGSWVETLEGDEIHLEALAMTVEGQDLLLIRKLGESYLEHLALLQKARDKSLTYQRLAKEVQKKEILLHCIVHDLAGPLTGIKSLFSLLGREDLSETARRRLQIGRDAADRLEKQIRTTLEVFSAELDALESFSSDHATAPDLADCLRSVVEILRPTASLKQLTLEITPALRGDLSWKVVGERSRLERVLFNLIDNALRHCSEGGSILICVACTEREILVRVEDNGKGVPDEEVLNLFRKFFQGSGSRGKIGLGLYFCRIVIERWGGVIGYDPRPEGGSVFWFRLPRIQS